MHGNLLGLPVSAARLQMVFRTRSFDRVQRLLQHFLLECLSEENNIVQLNVRTDQINFINRVGMPLVMGVKNYWWLPTFLIKNCLALMVMRGRE